MTDDQTLGDHDPAAAPQPAPTGPFGDPQATPLKPPVVRRQWSVAELLNNARTPQRYGRVCLRADLEAEHDRLVTELRTLVDVDGTIIGSDEETELGEETNVARAHRLHAEIETLRQQMRENTWWPRFDGLTADQFAVFNEQHYPKKEGVKLDRYYNELIAACIHEPEMSVDEVAGLRKTLGSKAITHLIEKATEVNTRGGVDVPFLPTSLANLTAP